MTFLDELPRPFFVMAPMDDVTDTVFRQIIADCARPDLFVTEFVNVDGLQSPGRPRLLRKLALSAKESPVVAQLWGLKPENFYKTAKEIADGTLVTEANALIGKPAAGIGFAGVDLNMGCPVKTVIKNGACAALINNRELAGQIIEATRQGVGGDFPVSVKTRVGFTTVDLDWIEFLLKYKLNMLSIHGRTAKQLSKVPADWQLVGRVRELRDSLCPATLVVGNGDVLNRAHGLELADKYKLDGLMIGRGIFHDPFAFAENSPWQKWTKNQKIELFRRHIELFAKTWQNGEYRFDSLKKFAKVYINEFDGASELRAEFMTARDSNEALQVIKDIKN